MATCVAVWRLSPPLTFLDRKSLKLHQGGNSELKQVLRIVASAVRLVSRDHVSGEQWPPHVTAKSGDCWLISFHNFAWTVFRPFDRTPTEQHFVVERWICDRFLITNAPFSMAVRTREHWPKSGFLQHTCSTTVKNHPVTAAGFLTQILCYAALQRPGSMDWLL